MKRMPDQLQAGITEDYAKWVAPRRKEVNTPHAVPFVQHSGNERYPTHIVDYGDFQIAAIPFLRNKFNAAAWLNGTTHLLAREIIDPRTITDYTPDVGRLVSLTMDKDKVIISERVIWRPSDTLGYNLEDPRAVDLGASDGRVALGLTAVSAKPDYKGDLPSYPALAYVDRTHPTKLEGLKVITEYGVGKNMMSLNVPGEENDWWVFRPDGSDHELLVLYDNKSTLQAVGTLPLPKEMPGFRFKAGTSSTPVWDDEQKGIFPFHGMEKPGLYIYSQGVAGIERKKTPQEQPFALINPVGPILHPDHFNPLRGEDPMALELHPNIRRAIYITGAVVLGDTFRSFDSIGDSVTVVVDRKLSDLREMVKT